MAVVGLDVGNLSCYVAVAAGGGIDTIANEYSDRNTPAFVSLNERNRFMGVSAKNQSTTNVKNTLSCFKRLIGRRFTDPQVQNELKNYIKPYSIVEGQAGETLIKASYLGEVQEFTPEQVMAMLLTKLKETGESGLKTKVVDVVVSVPCYFTDVERKSMIACCQMAGLNCLKAMNDTTAVSLAYGIYKQDLPPENEKARNVIFVDLGYTSLQVVATAFNKGKLKVLAVASDQNLGGRDFDKLIVDHFIGEWRTKYKIDALTRMKAYIRLTQESEKLKKLMSANQQPIPINIECFMEDKDVTGKMDRAMFEEMAASLLQKAEAVFRRILEATNLTGDELYSVEVVGGCSRIPCIKELVTRVFGKEPSTTLNADEAVAKGCALQCAILSPTFRVRDFAIQDCQPYPITLSWQGGGMEDDSSLEVFPQFHQIPFSKMLTFYRKEPFTIEARYSDPSNVCIQDPGIGMFTINKVAPQANGDSSKVKVKVRVNNQGVFVVQSASMIEKLEGAKGGDDPETMETDNQDENTEPAPAGAPMDTEPAQTTEEQGPDPKEEETKTEKDDEKKKDDKKDDKKDEKKEKKKKPTSKSIDLPVDSLVSNFTKEAINLLVEKENAMIMQDRLEKERADAKNAVEEYVYDMRDKLFGPYEDFCKEQDRENFSKLLGDTENWLYDEGEDQNKQVYLDKLAELRKTGDPIASRHRESGERPEAFNALGASLQLVRKFVTAWEGKDEKFAHLEKVDVEKVSKCLKEKTEWFDKQMNTQNRLAKFDPPAVLASQIWQNKQTLESTCSPIMNKPKPKPKEEPPKDEPKKEEAGTTAGEPKPEGGEPTKASGDNTGADAQKNGQPTPAAAEMEVD